MKLFFYSPKYIFNLSAVSRTMEVFGFKHAYVYDSHEILEETYGKSNRRKLNKTSSGAFSYIDFEKVEDPIAFIKNYPHRKIASVIHHKCVSLPTFTFEENDLIILGNETHGLEEEIIELSDHKVKIPQRGQTESLNLNISASIFIYEYSRQLVFN